LIKEGIIFLPLVDLDSLDSYDFEVPQWMKKSVNFWKKNLITNQEFFNSLEFILKNQIDKNLLLYD